MIVTYMKQNLNYSLIYVTSTDKSLGKKQKNKTKNH